MVAIAAIPLNAVTVFTPSASNVAATSSAIIREIVSD
jgi:hypothetical protein